MPIEHVVEAPKPKKKGKIVVENEKADMMEPEVPKYVKPQKPIQAAKPKAEKSDDFPSFG